MSPNPDSKIHTRTRSRILAFGLATLSSLPFLVANAGEPTMVTVIHPRRGEITRYAALPGGLRANQQVTVQARVAGFVKSIAVDRGDKVQSGQTLAEIEAPELLADRTKQLVEIKVAETEASRMEEARRKAPDLVTPQALDAANGRLEVARAELEKTETLLRYANLKAPFSGTITARFVDPGAFVPAGASGGASAVVTLADTSVLRAHVPVPETEAVLIQTGLPVRITVEGFPQEIFNAKVSRHSGALDETTRSLMVEADLPNPADRLRPGMFATVRIGVERHAGALLIPTESVSVEKTGSFVFRVDQGVVRKTPVKLGFQEGAMTEVVSGLTEAATLVSPAKSALADGAAVRVKEFP